MSLDERTSGQGILDYDVFLRRIEAMGPERFVVIEHAAIDEIPAAREFLARKAAELGIAMY